MPTKPKMNSTTVASRAAAPLLGRLIRQSAGSTAALLPALTSSSLSAVTAAGAAAANQQQQRTLATGAKGARGHGWYKKYRENRGGRHLQGRWHDRDVDKLNAINDRAFALNDSSKSNKAYLDLSVGGAEPGRIVIELASAALPVTCENFVKLCTDGGIVDAADRTAENWGYKGTNVHKIEKVRQQCRDARCKRSPDIYLSTLSRSVLYQNSLRRLLSPSSILRRLEFAWVMC